VINKIIQMGRNENMSEKDIGFMLAMSRVESGFNPDAAAGTTSASGIGQFIDTTGATYGINDTNRWDLESQVDALIGYTKFNKAKVIKDGRDQKELYKWMYKYHHDGPNSIEPTSTSLGWETATKKVNPLVDKYTDYVKSLDPLQGPELPERKSLGSIRPSARPETDLQVASN
jgi:putative chitinase